MRPPDCQQSTVGVQTVPMRVQGITQAIGVVVPYDMALDRELWRWVPQDVALLLTRTPYAPGDLTVDTVHRMGDPDAAGRSATDLLTVGPDCFAYACTSGSFIAGRSGERAITDAITTATGVPALTTSGALITAITTLGLERVAVANPYADDISEAFGAFLSEHGIGVAASHNGGFVRNIWQIDYRTAADLIRRADHPQAEAVVVCCTNLATYDLIAELEDELDKPVITANQATVWAALRLIGRDAVGSGQHLTGQHISDDRENERTDRGEQ